jgi:hypothetical protein
MPARHFSARARHCSSPYSRYHWSVSATTHSSPERLITCFSGSLYTIASPASIITSLMVVFTSFTGLPLNAPSNMTPSVNPFRYVWCFASSSFTLSF